jgi:hypothetical protein
MSSVSSGVPTHSLAGSPTMPQTSFRVTSPSLLAYETLAPPIHRPLYIITDDVVHPVGWDEEDPVCMLWFRGYLEGLVLSQLLRDLGEDLLGFF